jgi:hypothetical protein
VAEFPARYFPVAFWPETDWRPINFFGANAPNFKKDIVTEKC